MSDPNATFLATAEAAAILRVAPITLCKWRVSGRGPRFVNMGRAVRYRLADLLDWAETQSRRSTSETEAA